MSASTMMFVDYFVHSSLTLLVFTLIFGGLSRLMPCNPEQPLWREDTPTDLFYYFLSPFLQQAGRIAIIGAFTILLHKLFSDDTLVGYMETGYGPLATIPVWGQAAIVFIVSDVMLYWLHRLFHGRLLWNFHAIHHSSTQIDFLSTHRFHFVNLWFQFILVDTFMMSLGFSPEALLCLATFNALYSAMVHANLNWTFGHFKYTFASPVFHRWHHTTQKEGLNKNFAPTLPILDVLFGTFYMPEGKVPTRYGVYGQEIPNTFWAQLDWPFKQIKSPFKKR